MVRNALMVVSMRDLGSWLVAKAVSRLVRRFRIRDRLICGAWGMGEGGAVPAVAIAYDRVGLGAGGGGGGVVWRVELGLALVWVGRGAFGFGGDGNIGLGWI